MVTGKKIACGGTFLSRFCLALIGRENVRYLGLNELLIAGLFILLLSTAFMFSVVANPSTSVFVSPSNEAVNVGEAFNMQVEVANVTKLTCWEFKLFFNNAVLECTDTVEGSFLKSGGSTQWAETIDNMNGTLLLESTLTGLDAEVSGSGTLATIAFNSIALGESNLHLADTKLGDEHIPPQPIPHTTSDGIVYVSGPANTPPVASNLVISPSSPQMTDDLVGSYTYFDADGDPEAGSQIRWFRNEVLQKDYNDSLTIPFSLTTEGDAWYFTVRPKDGNDFGVSKTSFFVTIMKVSHDVAVTAVAPSKTVVGQGCLLHLNVTVENQAGMTVTLNTTAYANDKIIKKEPVTLTGHNSTNITLTWNTTGSTLGDYVMSASVTVFPDEIDVSDNTYVFGTIAVSVLGDLDCNGEVNIIDLVIAAMAFPCGPRDERWNPNADVNDDRRINILDITQIARRWWSFQLEPPARTKICMDPPVAEKTQSDVGSFFNITITIEHVSDLFGFDFRITWDDTLITLHACHYSSLDTIWGEGNWMLVMNEGGEGWWKIVALSLKKGFNTTSNQALFTLEFHVENPSDRPMRSTSIHFETHKLSNSRAQSIIHISEDGIYRIVQ